MEQVRRRNVKITSKLSKLCDFLLYLDSNGLKLKWIKIFQKFASWELDSGIRDSAEANLTRSCNFLEEAIFATATVTISRARFRRYAVHANPDDDNEARSHTWLSLARSLLSKRASSLPLEFAVPIRLGPVHGVGLRGMLQDGWKEDQVPWLSWQPALILPLLFYRHCPPLLAHPLLSCLRPFLVVVPRSRSTPSLVPSPVPLSFSNALGGTRTYVYTQTPTRVRHSERNTHPHIQTCTRECRSFLSLVLAATLGLSDFLVSSFSILSLFLSFCLLLLLFCSFFGVSRGWHFSLSLLFFFHS